MNSEIRDIFDRIAPVYDELNNSLSLGQHRIWKEMTVKWSAAKPGDTCLDLCCGSGDLAFRLAKYVGTTGQVYGVDFSPNLLAAAKERSQSQYPQPAISWIEADALNLPFDDHYFDAATMGYGLRNVTDIPRSLQELHRVLKPGAKAAILDFHRPRNQQLRAFQQWYLNSIVVPIANQMGLKEEYAYISPSLDRFPTGQEQIELARQVGFTLVTHYPIANDMMGVLVVSK
ncbi:bifunctional demethylmenaquinone methyltransferase/2-methoxy-6-polyprenyl-1,4-benzoquinol methylase UbiE [Nodularia sphaerocarpa]|uniref:bifunctional demethylmenaquinone methyltransferase/2-methoxy-6-polyprenyl-1,4-benzoquinol methylase UbiE n=1 Tax=Nodularia sphaerocarpa TaxID=137816 RepID=UPI001EFB023B|nr:bifunctional demethylmenaquinone methyltransferase/2-methoxy-6-polyprenyl-1,4-benzoquinol methylase UbiE [Nodularia sphaerocarpa]MDB9374707.1 bifunctional demethylmenaquinone methyltransferase/2-methoxy-6-polyprenyl-1,4-benzoquinol methylase UbiE [Nodularia sphaerocarpa CS-585]MDB9380293.1 bifunctional demethylmenaquinone methyltransferase/2-methoxy-6-polyprenyl-1,4-benzoquinol methylase UbiE [Nodularia sphaerocarpa CS-585A2]ULP72792.1 Demethylmenaquinone methyltransferase [Nodularia sphaeroc